MTREEAIELLDNLTGMVEDNQNSDYDTALKMAIKVLKQEPCEDAVSRQAVLNEKCLIELEDGQSFYCISPEDVEALPPVTPARKHGKWIKDKGDHMYHCTRCYTRWVHVDDMNYCPRCGADMRG